MRFGHITAILALCVTLAASGGARATTAVVFDADTGQVLHAEHPHQRWYPASLTKLMSAYVAFDVLREGRLQPGTMLQMSELANSQEPTKLWLPTGAELTLKTALGAMIVKSANDAAVMLAEGVGGELARFTRYGACEPRPGDTGTVSQEERAPPPMILFHRRASGLGAVRYDLAAQEWTLCRYRAFVARMNATARRLGMASTVFANANGLPDPRQITTARDLALLTRALIRDFPEHGEIFATRSLRYGRGRLRSYNSLLRTFSGADGMKTGFICASGYNIVASARRNERRIVAVVLGWSQASQRNARARALLEYGFRTTPARFGPHDQRLETLPSSGGEFVPPQDIRASLRARSCRRGPGFRLRFQYRQVIVRALDVPASPTVPIPESATKSRTEHKLTASGKAKQSRPKPKRVVRKTRVRPARKARKKKSGATKRGSANAGSALSGAASQR